MAERTYPAFFNEVTSAMLEAYCAEREAGIEVIDLSSTR